MLSPLMSPSSLPAGHVAAIEVASWVAGIAVAIAGMVGIVVSWGRRRAAARVARRYPHGLRLGLDVAQGDPGFVVFVLNRRGQDVRVAWGGVMRGADAPRGRFPRVADEADVDVRAVAAVSDMNGPHHGDVVLAAGEQRFLRSVPQPDDLVAPELMAKWQVPDPSPQVRAAAQAAMGSFEESRALCSGWCGDEPLVPFVHVPGVGWVFGAVSRGPFSETGGYRGFVCERCEHDFAVHEVGSRRSRRGLRARAGGLCESCDCAGFKGEGPVAPFLERDRG
jgi:hypothetical protein